MNRIELQPKITGETALYSFPFAVPTGVTISSAVTTATVYSGTDASPSSLINGSATISGATVSQSITAGSVGVIYYIKCTATLSDGQILAIGGYLAVVPEKVVA